MNNIRVHFATANYSIHLDNKPVKIKTILIILAGLLTGCNVFNTEPVIISLTADNTTVSPGGTVTLTCTAEDDDEDSLTYTWECTNGSLAPNSSTATWTAPGDLGTYSISCEVTDGNDGSALEIIDITVL
tara:strand:+ start:457 stop:846 length:390 start_codon:yes stop_codon:yes gene_type:complete